VNPKLLPSSSRLALANTKSRCPVRFLPLRWILVDGVYVSDAHTETKTEALRTAQLSKATDGTQMSTTRIITNLQRCPPKSFYLTASWRSGFGGRTLRARPW
jgi:hypothetical protein